VLDHWESDFDAYRDQYISFVYKWPRATRGQTDLYLVDNGDFL